MADIQSVVENQTSIGQAITQLSSNVGKDSKDRKTVEYFRKKLKYLEDLFESFAKNHQWLVTVEAQHPEENYFTSHYYERVETGYEILKLKLQTGLEEKLKSVTKHQADLNSEGNGQLPLQPAWTSNQVLEDDFAGASSSKGRRPTMDYSSQLTNVDRAQLDTKLHGLVKRQNSMMTALNHLLKQIEQAWSQVHSNHYYKLRIEQINSYWHQILNNNSNIWELADMESQPFGYTFESYYAVEQKVHDALIELSERLETHAAPSQPPHNNHIKLPTISIPVFDGDYLKWSQFYDIYKQMVHRTSLSNAEKMFYLNNSLQGEAKTLVQHLPVSDENYESAWALLEGRYNNKRILITSLLTKFLGQPTSQVESASTIKSLHDVTMECVLGLKNLNLNVDSWDAILVHIVIKKLDRATHSAYEQSLINPSEPQKLKDLLRFLELRFQSLEALGHKPRQQAEKHQGKSLQRFSNPRSALVAAQIECKLCQQPHHVFRCPQFLQMAPGVRLSKVKELKLCLNCLRDGHFAQQCPSGCCKTCNARHNTLLHEAVGNRRQTANFNSNRNNHSSEGQLPDSAAALAASSRPTAHVFLATARIEVLNRHGQPMECRALLDSGSQVNLITKKLATKLGLKSMEGDLNLSGVGGVAQQANQRTNIQLQSKLNNYARTIEAFIIEKIVDDQPSRTVDPSGWLIPSNIPLADPTFFKRTEIDMLIGAEYYNELMMVGQMSLNPMSKNPTLQKTVFGWVVLGKLENAYHSPTGSCGVVTTIEKNIQKLWEMDEVTETKTNFSPVEQQCERFFQETTVRDEAGRFVVRLPFKEDSTLLGASKDVANRRFMALERKLMRNDELRLQYSEFMKEYENLGHMEPIEEDNIPAVHYFIPHHCVLKPDSTTTKLRVVYDASCKTSTNTSLNQLLHSGPKIQQDLFDVFVRFRMHKYVFTGDIAKMYRQIWVHDRDCYFQLIYWRDAPHKKLQCYKLKTVTYGTTAAPYLAVKCLQTLADQHIENYPLGSKIAKTDFYVDDLMSGSDDLEEAIQQQMEVIAVLSSSGMQLRKWCSNHPSLLKNVPDQDIALKLDIRDERHEEVKTLGITWLPNQDVIAIKTSWHPQKKVTKRTVLSDVAHIFDPLGLLSPVVIIAKIFIQDLWKLRLDWDSSLPVNLHTRWENFREQLRCLDEITIPRHVCSAGATRKLELHAFSDASERAYGSVIYMRSSTEDGRTVKILCSKSRVTPTKITSIPRLELQAAKLSAELCHHLRKCLPFNEANVYYWTDSQIVLNWLNSESSSFQTFVSNRVSYIQQHTRVHQWRHVGTKENPADYISRGIFPNQLRDTKTWFEGPAFLQRSREEWPGEFVRANGSLPEEKIQKFILVSTSPSHIIFSINHRNSFSLLTRTYAYVLRFVHNLRCSKLSRRKSFLSTLETRESLLLIIKELQSLYFEKEIKDLKQNRQLDRNSRLLSLTPFLDAKGVLRVGGRIQAANLPYDAKHPMLLPTQHLFSKMIMTEIHEQHHHVGAQTLLAITRQRFWPIKGKHLATSVIHHCIQCFKTKPLPMMQLMGNLPSVRVQPGRPFVNAGVDYAGPIWTHFKVRGKRPQKSYIAVFCCLATKAVHLEVVTDLTADGFIGALRRFWSRRGNCRTLMSDNATNFVGGQHKLQEIHEMLTTRATQEKIHSECLSRGIDFHFIPPRAPHFGGLWESAVKSAKQLLLKSTGAASLTYEELCTLMAEIEAIINSRPISPMSSDSNDMTALTPGHFLIGDTLTSIVDPEAEALNVNNLARWRLVSHIKQEFWRRWSREYLCELQHRYKWKTTQNNAFPGLMVMIKEDNLPPTQWRLGRIVKTYQGPDSLTRVADVKTTSGVLKRPIHKLCPLPIETSKDDSLEKPKNLDNQNVAVKRPEKSKTEAASCKSLSALSVLLMVLLVLPNLGQASDPVEITNFEGFPGIYFESLGMTNLVNNEWHLIAYYDLKNYWIELDGFKEGVNRMIPVCEKLKTASYCQNVLVQFEHSLKEMEIFNSIILNQSSRGDRNKRSAFDFVGTVANKLFGVLDQDYAQQMATTIRSIDADEHYLYDLLKNQTSILGSTANIFKKSQEQVNNQFAAFDFHLKQITNQISKINNITVQADINNWFLRLAIQTMLIMNDYQKTQTRIIDVLLDAHQGKINPLLLTPAQIGFALQQIKNNLPSTLKLPFSTSSKTDILNIYNLLHVQGRVTDEHIIFRIQLPLASNNEFEAFRLIPIPMMLENDYVQLRTSSAYLVINLHRDIYYPMSELEAASCVKITTDNMLCNQVHPTYTRQSNESKCEVELLNHQPPQRYCQMDIIQVTPKWIQLMNPNNWIFSVAEKTIISIVCANNATSKTVQGIGMLKIKQNCIIKQAGVTISSHNVYPTEVRASFWPSINLTDVHTALKVQKLAPVPAITQLPFDSIQEVQNRISDLKSREDYPGVFQPHEIHQFAIGYVGLCAALGLMVYLGWSKYQATKVQRPPIQNIPLAAPRRRNLPNDFEFYIDEDIV